MGAGCTSEVKQNSYDAPPNVEAEASSQSFEDSDEDKSLIRRHLSTSSSVLRNLFLRRSKRSSSATSQDEDQTSDGNSDDEALGQLWEDCHDLSELIERSCLRFQRLEDDLGSKGDKLEHEQRCGKLVSFFVRSMEKSDFDGVVQELRSALFSTEKLEYDRFVQAHHLEITQRLGRAITETMIESFELFLLPVQMNDEFLIKATIRIWSEVFQIHADVEKIAKRLQNLQGFPSSDSNDDDLWRVLNLLLHLVQRTQRESPERARKLLDTISDLRNVLN